MRSTVPYPSDVECFEPGLPRGSRALESVKPVNLLDLPSDSDDTAYEGALRLPLHLGRIAPAFLLAESGGDSAASQIVCAYD